MQTPRTGFPVRIVLGIGHEDADVSHSLALLRVCRKRYRGCAAQ